MRTCLSWSGGKDSTALLVRLYELGLMPDVVHFVDTGLEFPEILDQVRRVQQHLGFKAVVLRPEKDFYTLFNKPVTRGRRVGQIRGMPFTAYGCWIQRDIKNKLMVQAQKDFDTVYIGFTADEVKRVTARWSKKYEFPLINWGWTGERCLNYLKNQKLAPQIYNRFKRTGCWLCPKQSKASIETLAQYYPELFLRLIELWRKSPHKWQNATFDILKARALKAHYCKS